MRDALLTATRSDQSLCSLDADFQHLLSSWFNRGFLELRRIDWSTPAETLERIIGYEAVHAINGWDELRGRVASPDRPFYGFFHPSMRADPVIFVEVALHHDIPAAIGPILDQGRRPLGPTKMTTAVFYSISNCQNGLRGVSFGNFLIKQVVEVLRHEFPALRTFVTLSPLPGFPLEGVACRVVDPAKGGAVSPGQVGAIEVRGPNVFKGFWRMPEKTAEEFCPDGFFKIGDIGMMDLDGYVSIVGRSKDLIIAGGYNVYRKEIEDRNDEIEGVKESAVIGVPHPDFAEAVVAVVVCASSTVLDTDAIRAQLASRLARHKQPKALFFVTELPRNAMGKVQKSALRASYSGIFLKRH